MGVLLVVVATRWYAGRGPGSPGPVAEPSPESIKPRGEVPSPAPPLPVAFSATLRAGTPFQALAATLDAIDAETNPLQKEQKLEDLANGIAAADLPAAVEFVKQYFSSASGRDLGLRLIRRWAQDHPRTAADWATKD